MYIYVAHPNEINGEKKGEKHGRFQICDEFDERLHDEAWSHDVCVWSGKGRGLAHGQGGPEGSKNDNEKKTVGTAAEGGELMEVEDDGGGGEFEIDQPVDNDNEENDPVIRKQLKISNLKDELETARDLVRDLEGKLMNEMDELNKLRELARSSAVDSSVHSTTSHLSESSDVNDINLDELGYYFLKKSLVYLFFHYNFFNSLKKNVRKKYDSKCVAYFFFLSMCIH